jgi:hypothetical protein
VSAPYQDLLRLAEQEVALAREGRWEELPAALGARARHAAALSAQPPAAARQALERVAVLGQELEALTAAARAETVRELGTLRRGRGAVRGYGSAGTVAGAASVYGDA